MAEEAVCSTMQDNHWITRWSPRYAA